MDRKLLGWGLRRKAPGLPRLWLFTDEERLPDPRGAVAGLPRGRAGVVFRHGDVGAPGRDGAAADLGRELAGICRQRRLALVVAGDVRLARALRAGVHLRRGRWPGVVRSRGLVTSSAHSVAELRRAARAGAVLVFLSPAFATASHVASSGRVAPGLGPARWGALARRRPAGGGPMRLAALGGVDGRSVLRLPPRHVRAVGAIGAFAPPGCSRRPGTSGRGGASALPPV